MRPVQIYRTDYFLKTPGHFFMIQDLDDTSGFRQQYRLRVGAAGPASLELSAGRTSFLYLGDPLQKERIEEDVFWTVEADGIQAADAVKFLKKHRIPYRIIGRSASVRKAERWLFEASGFLGQKGLLVLDTCRFEIRWYLAPDQMKMTRASTPLLMDSDRYTKEIAFHTGDDNFHPENFDRIRNVFERADSLSGCEPADFMPDLPAGISEFSFGEYGEPSANRHEYAVSARGGNCSDLTNVLNLSGYFEGSGDLFLAYSDASCMTVPCRIRLYGTKRRLEIPWETDPENTYLIYRDEASGSYIFESAAFTQRKDGSWCCCPQKSLKKHGIEPVIRSRKVCGELLKTWKKKNWNDEFFFASPHGFCFGTYELSYYGRAEHAVLSRQYLKDFRICGHKISEIRIMEDENTGDAGDLTCGELLPVLDLLFRWSGNICAENLLDDGESLLACPDICFETEDGTLFLNCPKERRQDMSEERRLQELEQLFQGSKDFCPAWMRKVMRFSRGEEVIWELDVTDKEWPEKANALVEKLLCSSFYSGSFGIKLSKI